MELNDKEIKNTIKRYFETKENKEKAQLITRFKKLTEMYIYMFPKLSFGHSDDVCSDFYLYVIERLESVIRNYPLDSELKFKTWFNYVLKNQLYNYFVYVKRKEKDSISIKEDTIYSLIDEETEDYDVIYKGLDNIPFEESFMLKLFYLPTKLSITEIREASIKFDIPVSEILHIQKEIIIAEQADNVRIRTIYEKLTEINSKLSEMKSDKETDVLKISRLENRRYNLLRELERPNKLVLAAFSRLLLDPVKAKYRLKQAKQKLKWAILKLKKAEGN